MRAILFLLVTMCFMLVGCNKQEILIADNDSNIVFEEDTSGDDDSNIVFEEDISEDAKKRIRLYEEEFGEGSVGYDNLGNFYLRDRVMYIIAENVEVQQLIDYINNDNYTVTYDNIGIGLIIFNENKTNEEMQAYIKFIEDSGLVEACSVDSIIQIGYD